MPGPQGPWPRRLLPVHLLGVRRLPSVPLCAGVETRGLKGSALLGHLVSPPTRQREPSPERLSSPPSSTVYNPHATRF